MVPALYKATCTGTPFFVSMVCRTSLRAHVTKGGMCASLGFWFYRPLEKKSKSQEKLNTDWIFYVEELLLNLF